MEILIRDSEAKDVKGVVSNITPEDKDEIEKLGMDPQKALFASYRYAVYRKTGLVDGEIAAMWGVCGTPLSTLGRPYFITTKKYKEVPVIKLARFYKKEFNNIKAIFSRLEGVVPVSHSAAIRLLKMNGAEFSKPRYIGPEEELFYDFVA